VLEFSRLFTPDIVNIPISSTMEVRFVPIPNGFIPFAKPSLDYLG
jgi:hypothetical protein